MKVPQTLTRAAWRAFRTAGQVYIGYIAQKWVASDVGVTVSGLGRAISRWSDAAAGAALVAAAAALGMNLRKPTVPGDPGRDGKPDVVIVAPPAPPRDP